MGAVGFSGANGQLSRAIRSDDIAQAAEALALGVDLGRVPASRFLHRVAAEGSARMAALLVDHGADIDLEFPDGWTALTVADAHENTAVAELLIQRGADVTARARHGFTPLHRAVRRGDLAEIEALLVAGDVDPRDTRAMTPLWHAVVGRRPAVAARLLAAGADPDVTDGRWSLLADAVYQDVIGEQATAFTQLLLDAGADPNPTGFPPILLAVDQCGARSDLLHLLHRTGADVDARGPRGTGVLHQIAEVHDDGDLVAAALACGAPIEATDEDGRTPLHLAAERANAVVVAALLAAGADPIARDHRGRCAADLVDDDPRPPFLRTDEVRRLLADASG